MRDVRTLNASRIRWLHGSFRIRMNADAVDAKGTAFGLPIKQIQTRASKPSSSCFKDCLVYQYITYFILNATFVIQCCP